ncbi:MAG: 3-hydroxyacyl-CoA dehydrogenase NAD-binding domain-containing protein, partial [Planctomycetota bacterium]|nr:3-hydroxyacyl-CoA dehydrogenase NAD-binding domain-containing protein [Planctomycetota bacterium]
VLHSIDTGLTKQVAKERLTDEERRAIIGRITVTDDVHRLADCDLVIESVVEDMEVKRELFEKLKDESYIEVLQKEPPAHLLKGVPPPAEFLPPGK